MFDSLKRKRHVGYIKLSTVLLFHIDFDLSTPRASFVNVCKCSSDHAYAQNLVVEQQNYK